MEKRAIKIFFGIIGIYALFCFWAPMFWLWDHLTQWHKWDHFMFEYLSGGEKIVCILAAAMSFATTLVVFMNLKDPVFLKDEE
jgi:hypothetical protein